MSFTSQPPTAYLWCTPFAPTDANCSSNKTSANKVNSLQTLGGTHIFGRMGMCRSNGSLFYKKSLNMGPIFYQKILKHGPTFLNEPKFSGFRMAKTPKIVKFLKNGPIFQEKTLKMGTLLCQNHR